MAAPITFTTDSGAVYADDGAGTLTLPDGATAPGYVRFCEVGRTAVLHTDHRFPSDGVVASIEG